MKIRLFARVDHCEEIPRGHGLVYVDYLRNQSVYALMPFNVLFGLARAAYLWMLFGYYKTSMARRERANAMPVNGMRAGVLFRLGSCWIGAHWSRANRRLCINLVPFVTIWITAPAGVTP